MNQLTLNVSFLNLNPKKLFLSWPRTGQAIGIISWTVTRWSYRFIDRGSHLCWKCLDWDLIRRFPAKKRIRRHVLPRCHHPPQPETLRWLHGGLLNQRVGRHAPAQTSETQSWVGFRRTWLDLSHQKSLQLWNWMNWKNCTKKKDFETWQTQTHSYMSHRVQRSCTHTTCTPTAKATYTQLHWLSSGTTSAHTPGLH